ncbi:MAG: MBL fold metallo-hydrolase [Armatimonadetes bacterium]|nr:MBL fold metallo-hydrolase [Armatimonadota bacterium]
MIQRWDVITIGNLSRNRYWGESDEHALREAWCTCTLIRGDGFSLLVDPSLRDPEAMARELDRRTGLTPEMIDAVFVTHQHGDHHWGIEPFTKAEWWAVGEVAEMINEHSPYTRPLEATEGHLFKGIDAIHTPGHTMEHHSLLFECAGQKVVIAGDAVMTRDFFAHRQGYFNSVDFALAAQTIERIATIADVVVPGHDNYFSVELTPFVDT